ncbi:unnamed protein product [Cuscuta epithymum]|uniref:Heparan-alpha-glucosaminide N-acetyltransferase catalytic domain-containing protein n=1 Tax=Cuscuta epithymum TaxID=186058 RepID=A0AAV0DPV4_9ASTE|nr:unnamed protein product [Cuscuta epithymum]
MLCSSPFSEIQKSGRMAEDHLPLLSDLEGAIKPCASVAKKRSSSSPARVASLDVFRGLSVFLMMVVDYGGSVFPIIAHCPWNGLHLADFVMPFFLFISGVSLSIAYKNVSNRLEASRKVVLKAFKLFLLGIFLQGGFLHGITSLTYGVDVERIRWLGILQRIAVGYAIAALCEIWLPCKKKTERGFFFYYIWHWGTAFLLTLIYLGLLYGLYVPDWEFSAPQLGSLHSYNETYVYKVNCAGRGDLGPACNSAAMIDRYILGIDHLYMKPVYRDLQECKISNPPSWCRAPFEPEGILSSLMAAVACILGLQYGHILLHSKEHKDRLYNWLVLSFPLLVTGLFLALIGIPPFNKSLYSLSYTMVTSATAGITLCTLYLLVDVYGQRRLTWLLEWIGKHSLTIFILLTSNIGVIAVQGFYWRTPQNNIVHWIVNHVVHKG